MLRRIYWEGEFTATMDLSGGNLRGVVQFFLVEISMVEFCVKGRGIFLRG